MPTLLDKVDQFWREVSESKNGRAARAARGETSLESRKPTSSSSRPPLPPSSKTKSRPSSNSNNQDIVTGRPPVPFSTAKVIKAHNNGNFDRNRRCYSSLALNSASGSNANKNDDNNGGDSNISCSSKNRKGQKCRLGIMSGSIADIYEFCKTQANKKLHNSSQLGRAKSLRKSNVFGGSSISVCAGYPSIQEEGVVTTERPARNTNDINSRSGTGKAVLNAEKTYCSPENSHFNRDDSQKKTTFFESHQQKPQIRRSISEKSNKGPSLCGGSNGGADQWVRDGAFERLDEPDITFPKEEKTKPANEIEQGDEEPTANDIEAIKMRWHKLGGSSSSSFSDRRPKSFDYAQRKAWMKLYRDMEVSQASGSSSISSSNPRISRPLSKGSITHLHLQETPSDLTASRDSVDEGDAASLSAMMRSTDISSTSPSLFKRFSKTFSLRFGSGTNVSKHGATGEVHRKSKSKGAIGSSPDLFNRVEMDASRDKVNGKMRKSNVKSVRGDKCQSGDSGIGMDEQQSAEPRHHASNLRRIRSDYISPTAMGLPSTSSSASAYAGRALTNGANKLSLVEIPDHSWDEHNSSPTEGSGASDTTSYEDLVDAKLDQDDGFSSSDEGQRPEQLQNPGYYHSLPHRKHSKRRLKETESTNSCGEVPKEDNSIRGKVVWEIILTEQNYVKTLNDIVQGFLNPCRARNDLFSSRTVQNIFSNIEEILRLHVKFLEALKSKVDPSFVSKSNVGGVFTSWADRFSLYSEYCCNNPISVATVRSLVQFPQYAEFFEACRRLQMMDKLPLHGFLLRPIQRICQYHLQLNELLKHTEESHADHKSVVEALETMKSVATKINDTQRQFESLQEIIRFQNSIDGWEGPNLVDRNAVILHKGELVKVTYGRKQKEVFVAVLNKDLIYCKKDFMKKSGYVFDGRIDLNLRMWINIDSNEEDEFFGMVHNSWRIYSRERRAWILFTAATPSEKRKWIGALEKTKEEIFVDPKLREMAVVTTALAESEISSNGSPHGHHSNTLPKSSKKSKVKQQLSTKVDQDAMLIEVGKLRRSSLYATSSSKEGSSKFYV